MFSIWKIVWRRARIDAISLIQAKIDSNWTTVEVEGMERSKWTCGASYKVKSTGLCDGLDIEY